MIIVLPEHVERLSSLKIPEVWLIPASSAACAAAEAQYGLLDDRERAKASSFKRPRDRGTYLVAHVGLRQILGAYLDLSPACVAFGREPCPACSGPHGRPTVASSPSVHFSLSHAEEMAAVAVALQPVGVDVEAARNIHCAELISLLHPAEQSALQTLAREEQEEAVLNCWVRKESYLKGLGVGLAVEPNGVNTGLGDRFSSVGITPGWSLASIVAPEGYAAAIALRNVGESRDMPKRITPRVLDVSSGIAPALQRLAQ
ncbi:4'-phosphopantetheinyl transferase family protein [Streptomyces sp. NPDC058297]|uniref:4'-phosphopantetheinyl transferase family protein n=1 Tax=Streptomyces sp. NPDC058297 TaxID=3346433 RepID=UPI0036E09747